MEKYIKSLMLIISVSVFSANAGQQKSPFKMLVQTSKTYVHSGIYSYRYKYTITSMTDGLVVNGVILNRGQCKTDAIAPMSAEKERQIMERLNRNAIMPRENSTSAQRDEPLGVSGVLNFSKTWVFHSNTNSSYTDCAPIEIVINTNKGQWSFNY
ncbi:hypothetical protein GP924_11425 [Enterobacteriaceae bacterium 8376wB9]|nr:hypothetical protein [Enterobacteriaceae bacterium 8376wB9]